MPGIYTFPLSGGGTVVPYKPGQGASKAKYLRNTIYGVGFAYPFRLNSKGTAPLVLSEEEVVRASIFSILDTRVGERPYAVKGGVMYGTRIADGLFESEMTARDMIPFETKRALDVWEPRIRVLGIDVYSKLNASGGSILEANLRFIYRSTNREDNIVRPYYLGGKKT